MHNITKTSTFKITGKVSTPRKSYSISGKQESSSSICLPMETENRVPDSDMNSGGSMSPKYMAFPPINSPLSPSPEQQPRKEQTYTPTHQSEFRYIHLERIAEYLLSIGGYDNNFSTLIRNAMRTVCELEEQSRIPSNKTFVCVQPKYTIHDIATLLLRMNPDAHIRSFTDCLAIILKDILKDISIIQDPALKNSSIKAVKEFLIKIHVLVNKFDPKAPVVFPPLANKIKT